MMVYFIDVYARHTASMSWHNVYFTDAYMRQWSRLSFVQKMVYRLMNAGPLSEPTLAYYWFGPLRTNSSEIIIEINTFSSKKCIWLHRLRIGGHFVSASGCKLGTTVSLAWAAAYFRTAGEREILLFEKKKPIKYGLGVSVANESLSKQSVTWWHCFLTICHQSSLFEINKIRTKLATLMWWLSFWLVKLNM